ncbi:hypothetical protein HRbin06_00392 [archaeon HR06]|nr:hypothetical protein HRbin06_00392 [archaeon HR06]
MGEKPTEAYILSLIASILILINSLIILIPFFAFGHFFNRFMGGMMTFWYPMFTGFFIVGLIAGIVILIGSLLLNSKPNQSVTWGTLILVFSILSLFTMGGFLVGAVLGIVGGILAITWKPPT